MLAWVVQNWGFIIAILGGGFGARIISSLTGKSFRAELREQIHVLDKRVTASEAETDGWRKSYYELYFKYKTFKLEARQTLLENGIDIEIINRAIPLVDDVKVI